MNISILRANCHFTLLFANLYYFSLSSGESYFTYSFTSLDFTHPWFIAPSELPFGIPFPSNFLFFPIATYIFLIYSIYFLYFILVMANVEDEPINVIEISSGDFVSDALSRTMVEDPYMLNVAHLAVTLSPPYCFH